MKKGEKDNEKPSGKVARRKEYIRKLRQGNLLEADAIYEVLIAQLWREEKPDTLEDYVSRTAEGQILRGAELYDTPFTLKDIWELHELREEYSDVVDYDVEEIIETQKIATEKFIRRNMNKTQLYSVILTAYQNIRAFVINESVPRGQVFSFTVVHNEICQIAAYLAGERGVEDFNNVHFKLPMLRAILEQYNEQKKPSAYIDASGNRKKLVWAEALRKMCDPLADDLLDILYSNSLERSSGAPKEATEKYLPRLLNTVGLQGKRGPKKKKSFLD